MIMIIMINIKHTNTQLEERTVLEKLAKTFSGQVIGVRIERQNMVGVEFAVPKR
jgi:hypothetical protein